MEPGNALLMDVPNFGEASRRTFNEIRYAAAILTNSTAESKTAGARILSEFFPRSKPHRAS
jgi:hypothetical protein